jgi:hypothetical protein
LTNSAFTTFVFSMPLRPPTVLIFVSPVVVSTGCLPMSKMRFVLYGFFLPPVFLRFLRLSCQTRAFSSFQPSKSLIAIGLGKGAI